MPTQQAGGRFWEGHALLERREAARLSAMTHSDRFDKNWVDDVEAALGRFKRVFPHSVQRAELELQLGEAYLAAIGRDRSRPAMRRAPRN